MESTRLREQQPGPQSTGTVPLTSSLRLVAPAVSGTFPPLVGEPSSDHPAFSKSYHGNDAVDSIIAVSSSDPVAQQQQEQLRKESLLLWKKPYRQVFFREWYIFHYCNERNVKWLDKIQRIAYPFRKIITAYLQIWSFTGEAEFYILFIPTLIWLGTPLDGMQVASMLCISQFVTGTLKDAVCCPRPPCPPLELRGKKVTHDMEYGFPSTHSAHSVIFGYFLYCELSKFFPEYPFLCWLTAVTFFVHVCFSRLYLGMHWIGDLIGGWVVAFAVVLFHTSFLDRWESSVLEWKDAPWWAYVAAYVVLHTVAITHATPHDACPCYVDSLRFTGVMVGAYSGFWVFSTQFGSMSARPRPDNLYNEAFSMAFFWQWITCILIVVVGKELSSIVSRPLLKVGFKFIAGVYAAKMPRFLRKPYLIFAHIVGLTTRGNERGASSYYPITANSSFDFVNARTSAENTPNNRKTKSMETAVEIGNANNNHHHCNMQPSSCKSPVEEPDGYLNPYQAWSLRTHGHWWLWDAHTRTASYFVTGFLVSYVCQVVLRVYFGVGAEQNKLAA